MKNILACYTAMFTDFENQFRSVSPPVKKHYCMECGAVRPVDSKGNDLHGMFCSEECKQLFRRRDDSIN